MFEEVASQAIPIVGAEIRMPRLDSLDERRFRYRATRSESRLDLVVDLLFDLRHLCSHALSSPTATAAKRATLASQKHHR